MGPVPGVRSVNIRSVNIRSVNIGVVVCLENQVEPFEAIWTSICHEVAGHKRIIIGSLAQKVASTLTFDTNDLLGHQHRVNGSRARALRECDGVQLSTLTAAAVE